MKYRFVEVEVVTAAKLEAVVNEWVERGWQLDAIRFVVGDGERRPRMAFVSFFRDVVRHEDLGELDLGESEPLELEMDWDKAVKKRSDAGKARRSRRR